MGAIMDMKKYLTSTAMLNYDEPSIQTLIEQKGWRSLPEFDRIRQIYNYVRDDILFGYNIDDNIPTSRVLKDGYGQCNTKAAPPLFGLEGDSAEHPSTLCYAPAFWPCVVLETAAPC